MAARISRISQPSAPTEIFTSTGYDFGNPLGKYLLSSLNLFIQNIARINAPGASSVSNAELASEAAGAELLFRLNEFVKAVIQPQDDAKQQSRESLSVSRGQGLPDDPSSDNMEMISIPELMEHPAELPTDIMESLRQKVFNVMPIRLLVFGPDGTDWQLIERSEVIRLCAFDIQQSIEFAKNSTSIDEGRYVFAREAIDGQPIERSQLVAQFTQYAILSHTWIRETPGDIIYGDLLNSFVDYSTSKKRGYNKITNFCKAAYNDQYISLAWVDTLCINKDSSSELDESIRSMYKWYRNASVCVAYLAETLHLVDMYRDSWFTRGWTLQELLAPEGLVFYNSEWKKMEDEWSASAPDMEVTLGMTLDMDITSQIEKATSIKPIELDYFREGRLDMVPISRRMQLAAKRQVTREEDTAYSLMGILGVDISIAYGEGRQRAFFRLVRELLTSKKSIIDVFNCAFFNSSVGSHPADSSRPTNLIPSDVKCYLGRASHFDYSSLRDDLSSSFYLKDITPIEPIVLTHLGVRIPLLLVPGISKLGQVRWDDNDHFGNFKALGDFYGQFMWESCTYRLLDRRIYNRHRANNAKYRWQPPEIVTFGVLNFWMDSGNIILPKYCLSIPLDCGNKVGDVSPVDIIGIVEVTTAPWFRLYTRKSRSHFWIPKDELARHGLQLITLYL